MPTFPSGGQSSWQNLAEFYCSPNGNDGNDGIGWNTPKKHVYNALKALIDAGGGTLHIADGTSVGGPVANQGIRIRCDFIQGVAKAFPSPGFLGGNVPLRLVGAGQSNGTPSFFTGTMARYIGGTDRFNPPLWVVGSNPMNTLRIENLRGNDSAQLGARIGPDYDRNVDGSIKDVTVTGATRTGTTTVFTVSLGNPLTIKSASRTSNVTTLYFDNPGLPWIPARKNCPIVFTSGDGSFPSGAFVLTDTSNGLDVPDDTTHFRMSYSDPGIDVVKKDIAGSSFVTHGCAPGELIDLTSNTADFANTQFMVDSVNADGLHITVTDVFGNGDKTDANIGHINHQERYSNPTCNFQMYNCTYLCASADPASYHGIDIGNNSAMLPQFYKTSFSGTVGDGTGPRDENRMSAMFVYPGTGVSGAISAVYMRECGSTDGSVYVKTNVAQGYSSTDIQNLITDTSFPGLGLPAVRIDGNSFSRCILDQIFNADTNPSFNAVELNNMSPSGCYVTRSGKVAGQCVGGDMWINPNLWIASASPMDNPWTRKQVTNWADGRVSGKHPAAIRAMGVSGARFKNIIADPSTWTLRGSARTLAQVAPDGSSTAVKIVSAGDFVSIFPSGTDGNTWEVGGRFVIAGWVNADDPAAYHSSDMFRCNSAQITFEEGASIGAPYTGLGWQFVSASLKVATLSSSTPTFEVETLSFNGKAMYFWGMTAFYIPLSVTDNDAYELIGAIKQQPRYLLSGMAGTMEGGKLIAHGGLGTAARYVVGGGSGQITLGAATGKAVELFDESGNSLGVVAPLSFTVNP